MKKSHIGGDRGNKLTREFSKNVIWSSCKSSFFEGLANIVE